MRGGRLPKDAWTFLDDVRVECPRCAGLARVLVGLSTRRSTLTCGSCGHIETAGPYAGYRPESLREGLDPVFHRPLWLREPVGRGVVWALNWRHFEELVYFLEGDWRGHRHHLGLPGYKPTWSYRVHLPKWMQQTANRAAIRRALGHIRRRRLNKDRTSSR